jgi:hypothetical protein
MNENLVNVAKFEVSRAVMVEVKVLWVATLYSAAVGY